MTNETCTKISDVDAEYTQTFRAQLQSFNLFFYCGFKKFNDSEAKPEKIFDVCVRLLVNTPKSAKELRSNKKTASSSVDLIAAVAFFESVQGYSQKFSIVINFGVPRLRADDTDIPKTLADRN